MKPKEKFSVVIQTDKMQKLINSTLSDPKRAQRFIASISSAVATNPSLQECTPNSIICGALLGEALELSPSPQLGQYYLVKYNRSVKQEDGSTVQIPEAAFQIGYKGFIQLAIRSGQYKDIDVIEIKEGECLGRNEETGVFEFKFITDEVVRSTKKTIGYLGYFELLNGFKKKLYMSKVDMEIHANTYSKAFDLETYKKIQAGQIPQKDMWKYSSYWYKSFDTMAFKTILRQLLSKWGVMSIEMQEAFTKDSAVLKENGDFDYVDNPSDVFESDVIELDTQDIKEKADKIVKTKKLDEV